MKDKLIVITSYPPQNTLYGKGISGLASFAKNTVTEISKDREVVVLAENEEKKVREYSENSVNVKRVWQKNSIKMYFQLLAQLLQYRQVSNQILLEFEFTVFGNPLITGFMPLFLIISMLVGFKTTTVLHQVITDKQTIAQNLGISEKGLKINLINIAYKSFTKLLVNLSNKIIVLDEIHKENLTKLVKTEKVYVIAHGVEQKEIENVLRKDVDNINILYFGYLTWYKGADWLINAYLKFQNEQPELAKRITITLAGGESPTQKNNPSYQRFYSELLELSKQSSNINITGFVNEEDFSSYFSKADIQVLPYRTIMSSSGPLSLAYTYEKPVLISNAISPYLRTKDAKTIMQELNIDESNLIFDLKNSSDLFLKILNLKIEDLNKLARFSISMKAARNWHNIGNQYIKILKDN